MYDSVMALAHGLAALDRATSLRLANLSCDIEQPWNDGSSLFNYINTVRSSNINPTTFLFFSLKTTGRLCRPDGHRPLQRGTPNQHDAGPAQIETREPHQSGRVEPSKGPQHHRPGGLLRRLHAQHHPHCHDQRGDDNYNQLGGYLLVTGPTDGRP